MQFSVEWLELSIVNRIANGTGQLCKLFWREIDSVDKGFGDLNRCEGLDRKSLAGKSEIFGSERPCHGCRTVRQLTGLQRLIFGVVCKDYEQSFDALIDLIKSQYLNAIQLLTKSLKGGLLFGRIKCIAVACNDHTIWF